ncbi:hypothetical protein [Streptomyces sp. NPDC001435]|uniref:hypothetical protein n=1 Tax=unclassified Streptomyces TaxID=2593676 RepID=UPI0036ACA70E
MAAFFVGGGRLGAEPDAGDCVHGRASGTTWTAQRVHLAARGAAQLDVVCGELPEASSSQCATKLYEEVGVFFG